MQLDSSDVAYDFKDLSTEHSCHETPRTMANAEIGLTKKKDGEKCKVERIASQGRDVVDACPLVGTYVIGA